MALSLSLSLSFSRPPSPSLSLRDHAAATAGLVAACTRFPVLEKMAATDLAPEAKLTCYQPTPYLALEAKLAPQ